MFCFVCLMFVVVLFVLVGCVDELLMFVVLFDDKV